MAETKRHTRQPYQRNKANFRDRATYYLAREVYDQGRRPGDGEWKYDLLPVVGVFLTNFFVNGIDRELVVPGKILNPRTGNAVLDKMSCYFVQLEAFDKTKEECETGFDKWIYLLKNMERLQEIPFKEYKDRIFTRLGEISKVANLSEEELQRYRDYQKWTRDYYSELDYARQEGRNEGITEGMAEGRKEGREEENRKWVASLKGIGMDTATIAKLSGLSEAEIAKL